MAVKGRGSMDPQRVRVFGSVIEVDYHACVRPGVPGAQNQFGTAVCWVSASSMTASTVSGPCVQRRMADNQQSGKHRRIGLDGLFRQVQLFGGCRTRTSTNGRPSRARSPVMRRLFGGRACRCRKRPRHQQMGRFADRERGLA